MITAVLAKSEVVSTTGMLQQFSDENVPKITPTHVQLINDTDRLWTRLLDTQPP